MVCFSETRCRSQAGFVEGMHRLICSNDESAVSSLSGVIILIHNQWIGAIKRTICLHDRVMAIDLRISQRIIRFITVNLSNSGISKGSYRIRIASDMQWLWFEISIFYLNEDDRGRIIEEFCMDFLMNITNGTTPYDDPDT